MFRTVAPRPIGIPLAVCLGVAIIVAGCGSVAAPAASIAVASPPASAPATSSATESSSSPSTAPSASLGPHWTYVALGDSNTYGAPGDCNNCTTYPSRWAAQITADTGMPVELHDLSEHNHLTTDLLLSEIKEDDAIGRPNEPVADEISKADIITISVGGNDLPWSQPADPCYPKYDATCLKNARTAYATNLEGVLAQIDRLRAGKPTLIRLLNLFSDVVGDTADGAAFEAQTISAIPAIMAAQNAVVASEAARHHALVVDLFHIVNGPQGKLSADPFLGLGDGSNGDLNDRGQVLIAAALAKLGYAPLN